MATSDQPSTSYSPAKETESRNDVIYKVKKIKYDGSSKHIVLQNENGPCPLIAISNVLLLINDRNLDLYTSEVSQTRLLDFVSNTLKLSNIDFYKTDEDEEKSKNVTDADKRIPRLADGINVNIKFKSIDDFELTPELDIFRLLDIRLYHGWIVDPQDSETANAIGGKSYNDLMTELVALETQSLKAQSSQISGEGSVDLSMPRPSPLGLGKGDYEENIVLLRTLKLSEREKYGFDVNENASNEEDSEDENQTFEDDILETSVDAAAGGICQENKADDQFLFKSETDCDVGIKINVEEEAHSTLGSTELGDETVFDVDTTETISGDKSNLESTENDCISEIPLKSEDVTFANPVPDSSVRSQDEGEELLGKSDTNEGEVIRRFLDSNATQLTFQGIISLKEGLEEMKPCVFFRNNHFSTMIKVKNELYMLVTDEGYLTTLDVVWERLDEVNGDSVYVNDKFEVFKTDSDSSESKNWNPLDAITDAANFMHNINSSLNKSSDMDPDLKLAMKLQEEEIRKGSEVRDEYNPYGF